MDSKTYLSESERTVSEGYFHAGIVPDSAIAGFVRDFVDFARRADILKKSLFYGRPYDVTEGGFHNDSGDIPAQGYDIDLFHATIGILTESGEMMEALLKQAQGDELDIVNMKEELGDTEFYLAMIYRALNTLPETEKARNIAKLRKRYPGKFTSENAISRDLETERKTLEDDFDAQAG